MCYGANLAHKSQQANAPPCGGLLLKNIKETVSLTGILGLTFALKSWYSQPY